MYPLGDESHRYVRGLPDGQFHVLLSTVLSVSLKIITIVVFCACSTQIISDLHVGIRASAGEESLAF